MTGNGNKRASGFLTLLVSYLTASATQSVRQYQGLSQEFDYTFDADSSSLQLQATAHDRRLIFLFRGVQPISRDIKVIAQTSKTSGPALLPELSTIDEVIMIVAKACC